MIKQYMPASRRAVLSGAAVMLLLPACGTAPKQDGDTADTASVESALQSSEAKGQLDAVTGTNVESPHSSLAQNQREWRQAMSRKRVPKHGCFQASHPDPDWQEIPCGVAPAKHYMSPRGIVPYTVGNGYNYSAQVSGTITAVRGSFPSVTGVTSESDGTANSFSLQINTNTFSTTSCDGHANCSGWQQFIFANGGTSAQVFMQYWLIGYGNTCPTWKIGNNGWVQQTDNLGHPVGNCYINSAATNVPAVAITSLANVTLQGQASSSGVDTAIINTGPGDLYAQGQDTVLNVAQGWNFAEFNIFGNGSGTPVASFNNGSTVVVRTAVTNGTTASPTCVTSGTTYEQNNLNLVPSSCCSNGGTQPAIQFIQSNASSLPQPSFCLLNDITPINFSLD